MGVLRHREACGVWQRRSGVPAGEPGGYSINARSSGGLEGKSARIAELFRAAGSSHLTPGVRQATFGAAVRHPAVPVQGREKS